MRVCSAGGLAVAAEARKRMAGESTALVGSAVASVGTCIAGTPEAAATNGMLAASGTRAAGIDAKEPCAAPT